MSEEEHEGIPVEIEEKIVAAIKKRLKKEKTPELDEGKPAVEGPE